MNLNYTDDDNKFRKKIKDFIKSNLSQEAQRRVLNGGKYTKDEIHFAKKLVDLFSEDRAADYEKWRDVGICLKCIDESLLNKWIEFSMKWSGYIDDKECRQKWIEFNK